jgi:3-methyladenine DNA glycosylase AlkD
MAPQNPKQLSLVIDRRLRDLADPEFAEGQRRFFKHEISTYGVRTTDLHAAARDVYKIVKPWPVEERDELMDRLWRMKGLEAAGLGIYVYRRFAKTCGEREFRLFENWVDRYVNNWASCDGVASWLMAASIGNCPHLALELPGWTGSENRWRKRASAVALLQEAKAGSGLDIIFTVAGRLLGVRDDMVEKGVGWLLKETYPKRPVETLAFLMDRRGEASRLTLRYAAEKMSAGDRRRLLS